MYAATNPPTTNTMMVVVAAILIPVGTIGALCIGGRCCYLYYLKRRLRSTQTIFRGLSTYEYNPVATAEEQYTDG